MKSSNGLETEEGRRRIIAAVNEAGNYAGAATILGVSVSTLRTYILLHRIEIERIYRIEAK